MYREKQSDFWFGYKCILRPWSRKNILQIFNIVSFLPLSNSSKKFQNVKSFMKGSHKCHKRSQLVNFPDNNWFSFWPFFVFFFFWAFHSIFFWLITCLLYYRTSGVSHTSSICIITTPSPKMLRHHWSCWSEYHMLC